jgi:hypothetical protein
MTPGEVNGLQSLAMAHGGSLSINPQTGLPEAGFLSGILPMLAGAALASTGVGAPMAALMIGGAGTVATGSLSKGLMMGLGAYGGAGLGAGLMGGAASAAGAAGAGAAGMAPMVSAGAMPGVVGGMGAMAPAVGGAAGAAGAATGAAGAMPAALQSATGVVPQTVSQMPMNAVNAGNVGNSFMPTATNAPVVSTAPQVTNAPAPSLQSALEKFKSIPGKAFDLISGSGPEADKAREEFIKKNKNYMLMGGLGVLGASRDDPRRPKEQQYNVSDYDWNTRSFSPSSQVPGSTGERTYFAADGGLMGLPVEQMSQQNASSENTRYPMAFQKTPSYSMSSERPIPQNVVYPATDTDITPYGGAERGMANGGVVALATGGAAAPKATPQETSYNNWLKTKIKPYDLSKIAEPKGGFTAANVVSTYGAALNKERAELVNSENLLKSYLDPKTGKPKPGYDAIVDSLRGIVDEQRNNLTDIVNTVYEKIPKTDINFDDPSKAALQKTNQTNEFNAVNTLLNNYVNNTSLKGTDFAKDYVNKLATENSQKLESGLYADKLAPALKALSEYTGKNAQGKDIAGGLSDLTTGWNAETKRQSDDVAKLKATLVSAGLMDAKGNFTPAADKYAGLTGVARSALEKQISEVDTATGAKQEALQGFGTSTARATTGIGSRALKTTGGGNREDIQAQIDEIMANPAGGYSGLGGGSQLSPQQQTEINALKKQLTTPKQVFDPEKGTFVPEKVVPKYQPITYGSVTATKGWDTAVKYIEPDDVTRVFEEVAGRKPTESELSKYVGTKNSIQGIANSVNGLKDLTLAKQFTDDEIQAQAKYYWGREMTGGELANYKAKKYGNFAALRNALTSEKMYVDNLNNINKGIVDQQNKPVVNPLTEIDVSSAFVDVLGRKPKNKAEAKTYLDKNISIEDLRKELKETPEYKKRLYQPEEQVDEEGNVVTTPEGGGTGVVPPITYKPVTTTPGTMTKADMDAYTKQYAAGFTPAAYATAGSGAAAPSGTASGTSPYQPLTGPEFSIAGSLPYQDINKQLGLTGLYSQMSQKMPELQQGLNFDQSQAKAMASPFANVTPGLVTLQSAATPQPYVPPTPVIPGQQVYSPAITPEEQALLSVLQRQPQNMASGGMTSYNLGGYSDGGRLLKGPGDGVSDSIPASIGDKQPARLADGEFVIPARIVSEIGNGSTDAGARKLYAMMERVQRARKKTVGRGRVAVKSGADNMLPA